MGPLGILSGFKKPRPGYGAYLSSPEDPLSINIDTQDQLEPLVGIQFGIIVDQKKKEKLPTHAEIHLNQDSGLLYNVYVSLGGKSSPTSMIKMQL